jgi:hypothetical protein
MRRNRHGRAAILIVAALWCAGGGARRAVAVDSTWSGNDGAWSDGANWDTDPVVPATLADSATIGAGIVTVDDEFSIGQLFWTGGALVRGATAVEDSVLTVATSATISGPDEKHFATTTLNLNGATTWSEGTINTVETLEHPEGGVVNIGGAFDIQFDGLWSWNATATPTINVGATGSLVKSGGEGTAALWPLVHNQGLIDVQSGALHLAGGGTSGGRFTVAEGATLLISDFNELYGYAGAETTTLDVDSEIEASAGSTVAFTNLFGNSRTDVYGTIDAALVDADPGELGLVLFHEGSSLGATTRGSYTVTSGVTAFDAMSAGVIDVIVNDEAVIDLVNDATLNVSGAINVNEGGVLYVGNVTSPASILLDDATQEQLITGSGEIVLGHEHSSLGAAHALRIDSEMTVRGRGRVMGGTDGFGTPGGVLVQGVTSADVAGGTLKLDKATIAPGGVAEATGGGRLILGFLWDNNGTLRVTDGSTLELSGAFDTPNIGVVQRTGTTTVELTGFLTNTSQTLDIHTTTGSLVLKAGSQIIGGRVQSSGASTLTSLGGALIGVTLATDLGTAAGPGIEVDVANGLTLDNAKIYVGNGAFRSASVAPQTVGGTGEIVLAGGDLVNYGLGVPSGTVNMTIGPHVVVRGRGTLDGGTLTSASAMFNEGTIRTEGLGVTLVLKQVRNSGGEIHATATNTIQFWPPSSGPINVQTAGTITVDSGGFIDLYRPIEIQGGSLTGGGTIRTPPLGGTQSLTMTAGGTIAPGASIGTLSIEGTNVTFGNGGRLAIELSGSTSDLLQVNGPGFLKGDLSLQFLNNLDVIVLSPLTATSYVIATYTGTLTGTFQSVTPGYSVTYDTALKRIVLNVLPRADFDMDCDVDGGDFLTWQRGLGISSGATKSQGDANGDGAVNAADLALWRSQFGTPGATAASASVPEPSGAMLLLAALGSATWGRRRRGGTRSV